MAGDMFQRQSDLSEMRRRTDFEGRREDDRPYRSHATEETKSTLPGEYLRTLRRHRGLIAICAGVGVLLFLLSGATSQPIYRSHTSLEMQSLNTEFLDMRSVAATGDNSAAAADMNLQTQIKLLQTDTLFAKTVAELEEAPHPATMPRKDLLSRVTRLLHIPFGTPIPYDKLVEDAAQRVVVKPMGMTRLVNITCDSWDAEFSAKFCNVLTNRFQEQDLQNRTNEARKTSNWLTEQVSEMRQKTEDSEKKLEEATGGNGLILSQQSSSVGEDRLRSLQGELVKAQADLVQQEAQRKAAAGAVPDTMPNLLDNPSYRAYEATLAQLRSDVAKLVPPLTEENPRVIHLRAQIREAEAGMEAVRSSTMGRQFNEYTAAKHRQDLLALSYAHQEAAVSSDLQKASRVSLLRREVDSEQQLYLTLLQRAKEAGFASALQATTIRVVDPAQPPIFAASPRRSMEAITGMALGSLFGIGLSFYKDRNSRVFRGPGDVARFLHMEELGVIPAAEERKPLGLSVRVPTLLASTNGGEAIPAQGRALLLTRWDEGFSLMAEAYRNATFSIMRADGGKRARTYVVSSPNAGDGKTTVTSNLGVALSKSKVRVVLVDGDLRKSSLHSAFGVRNDFGLRNILRGEIALESAPVSQYAKPSPLYNLSVIPSGTGDEDVVELLHSAQFSILLNKLSREFDVVLIDTPPMLHMADARIFAAQTDGTIFIFRAGVTTREDAVSARDLFERDGVRLVGSILNDFDPAREGRDGYYDSYYRYKKHEDTTAVAS